MLNYDIIKKIIPEPIRNVVSKRLPPIDSSGIVKPISERTASRVLDCLRNTNNVTASFIVETTGLHKGTRRTKLDKINYISVIGGYEDAKQKNARHYVYNARFRTNLQS